MSRNIILFVFVLTISGPVLADCVHPHYSFRCLESGRIYVFGIHDGSIVTYIDGTCKDRTTSPERGIINIPYNCTNATDEKAYEISISVKDPVFGEYTKSSTTTKTTTSVSPQSTEQIQSTDSETTEETTTEAVEIIGGHKEHKFVIKCLNIPSSGVNKTVAHVFQGGPHKLPENQKEVFPVEMHFKATKNIDAPDISEIYIGDEFFMFLKYTGASHYAVIPKSCTAYAGTVVPVDEKLDSKKRVNLWDENRVRTL
ncbi:uncharacterized protein LOC134258591 [Saccostrea cucullata]|uniref:uncharacterized protein LOC134258591 n=1 Tax=Saccostrea cuccullata TaxID=36930 RepID=UPI002ED4E849